MTVVGVTCAKTGRDGTNRSNASNLFGMFMGFVLLNFFLLHSYFLLCLAELQPGHGDLAGLFDVLGPVNNMAAVEAVGGHVAADSLHVALAGDEALEVARVVEGRIGRE